jgi:hypothetical protein
MIYHIWSVPCLRVIVDELKRFPSAIDIVDHVQIEEGEPLILPPFHLLSYWGTHDESSGGQEFDIRLSIKGSEQKKKQIVKQFNVRITPKGKRVLVDVAVDNIRLGSAGEWFCFVEWQLPGQNSWKTAASFPVAVSIVPSRKKKA